MLSKLGRLVVVVALIAVVGVVVAMKKPRSTGPATQPSIEASLTQTLPVGLPRLLNVGSTCCIAGKMMASILEQLKQEQVGALQVDFIDMNADGETTQKHGVSMNPTQIFFDVSGNEIWRHEGFLAKHDILAKWQELGFDLVAGATAAPLPSAEEPQAGSGLEGS